MYCQYCGGSYTAYTCSVCGEVFETCDCENGTMCDDCIEDEETEEDEDA